jgi:surface antigen
MEGPRVQGMFRGTTTTRGRARSALRWKLRSAGALVSATALLSVAFSVFVLAGRAAAVTGADYGYPYPNAPDCNEQTGASCVTDQWGFVEGQCHSWVAYRLNELNAAELNGATFDNTYGQPAGDTWGDAWEWGTSAANAGIVVDDTPGLGAVAWWSQNGGHVAYVEAVNDDGTVTVSEMNHDLHNGFDFATLQRGARWPDGFIHIADRTTTSTDPPPTVPSGPTGATATAGDGQASVQWNASLNDGGSSIISYTVTASPGGQSATTNAPEGATVLTTTVAGLTNGTSYTFRVHAMNAVGNSAASAASNAVVPAGAPGTPQAVTANAGDGTAAVSWNAPASNGAAIQSYSVTASPSGEVVAVDSPTTSAQFTGLTNGTEYTFTVHATNAVGDGAESAASNTVVPAGVPATPGPVIARTVRTHLTVAWQAPDDNGAPLTGYEVDAYRAGRHVATMAAGPTVTSLSVSTLTRGLAYTFRISATNRAGTSPLSAASNPAILAKVHHHPSAPVAKPATGKPSAGYWMVTERGRVYAFGDVAHFGDLVMGERALQIVPWWDGRGYDILTPDHVESLGTARGQGAWPDLHLQPGEQVTSMALFRTPVAGYWLFTSAGRAIPVGKPAGARTHLPFFGDLRHLALHAPVLGAVATPTGHGYYMVASDGGVFAFGDARFYGSMGDRPLDQPIVALLPTADNRGYWLVASDGGVFAFGDARFRGSLGGRPLAQPIVGVVRYGNGYLMVASDGGAFDFSNLPFAGSLGNRQVASPVVSIAATNP